MVRPPTPVHLDLRARVMFLASFEASAGSLGREIVPNDPFTAARASRVTLKFYQIPNPRRRGGYATQGPEFESNS